MFCQHWLPQKCHKVLYGSTSCQKVGTDGYWEAYLSRKAGGGDWREVGRGQQGRVGDGEESRFNISSAHQSLTAFLGPICLHELTWTSTSYITGACLSSGIESFVAAGAYLEARE